VTRQASENEVGERIEAMRRRPQRFRDERITMAHGAGGKASRALVEGLIVPLLTNPALEQLTDAGLVTVAGARLALTTDAYVVRPTGWRPGTSGSRCPWPHTAARPEALRAKQRMAGQDRAAAGRAAYARLVFAPAAKAVPRRSRTKLELRRFRGRQARALVVGRR